MAAGAIDQAIEARIGFVGAHVEPVRGDGLHPPRRKASIEIEEHADVETTANAGELGGERMDADDHRLSVLRDEVRHRALGWTLLDWLLATQPEPDRIRRRVARDLLPLDFFGLRYSYAQALDAHMPAHERAWGLMPGRDYAATLDRTFERQYRPWFAERGIDAGPAWEEAAERLRAEAGPAPGAAEDPPIG